MKCLLKIILSISLLSTFAFAVTPFSLEGLKSVNFKVIDKKKVLKKETVLKIEKDVEKGLKKLGIDTTTDEFSNFLIKISVKKVEKKDVVLVSLFLVESVNPIRNKELQNVGITYRKDDFFIADELDEDVYESAVEFLFYSFEEQFLEEQE